MTNPNKVLAVVIGALCIALVGVTVLAMSLNTRLEAENLAEYRAGYKAGVVDQNERWLSWELDSWGDFLAENSRDGYKKVGSGHFPLQFQPWPGHLPCGWGAKDISGLEAGEMYRIK